MGGIHTHAMSYVIEQTESLLRVSESAVPAAAHRLAGYEIGK